jgi:sugar O-acyltransferase (sialic acid O-acetyltransferase NeuD family)
LITNPPAQESATAMQVVIVAGSSGQHAAVVYEAAILARMSVAGFVTIDADARPTVLDCRCLGGPDMLEDPALLRDVSFVPACGSNEDRRSVAEAIITNDGTLGIVVHPRATVSPTAVIGAGSVVLAGAIVGPSARIGRCCIVNHAASVDHDCVVGDYANLCPGARLGGTVHVGDGAFIGLNASVLQGLRIGQDAIVGAGAVVIADVSAQATMVGNPARRLDDNR